MVFNYKKLEDVAARKSCRTTIDIGQKNKKG